MKDDPPTRPDDQKRTHDNVQARATFHLGALKEALDQLVASGDLKPGEVPTFRIVDPETPDLEDYPSEDLERN